jgi:hypothetical protein
MRIKTFAGAAFGLLFGLAATQPAYAGAIIDFTDDLWKPLEAGDTNSKRTRTLGFLGNVSIEALAPDGSAADLTFMGGVPGSPTPPCDFLACDNDGAGVTDDEVTFGVGFKEEVERLLVTFENSIDLKKFHFLDLFGVNSQTNDPEAETAQWQINGDGGPGGVLTGTATDTVGYAVTGNINEFGMQIEFFADTAFTPSSDNSDFALAAIEIPVPGTLGLLGAGLLGLGAFARRRVAHA